MAHFLCALSSSSGDFTRIYSQRRTVRCAFFTPLSLSPSIPFTSLSLSLPLFPSLYPSLSPSLSISYLSLPLYIFRSTFLSLSLLFIILFGVSNGRFRPCFFVTFHVRLFSDLDFYI